MAPWPRSAARWTISSGKEAASRKLNAERVWKSTKLVIHAFHEPLLRRTIQIDAVQRAIAQRQIVFIPIPRIRFPPIAIGSPRSCDLENLALEHPRPQTIRGDARFKRRPEVSKWQQGSARPPRSRTVRIEQFRITHIFLAHH